MSTALASAVLDACRKTRLKVTTAESCTGGLVAAALTDIAGSSAVFDCGFVTYSNASKVALLGVRDATIAVHGAVSGETAIEMAAGALARSDADIAVAITGIAGPGGGSGGKPVGLVWFAVARRGSETVSVAHHFADHGRASIRAEACETALSLLLDASTA